MEVQAPTSDFVTVVEDSRRWGGIALRADDIIISTPPKCGTTWVQGIVASLLWPAGDAPGNLDDLSPWVDIRLGTAQELAARLEAQTHRRFIKTHSPADAIPLTPEIPYIAVYRSAPDALVSWGNHRAKMRPGVMAHLNGESAADGLTPLPLTFEGDYDELLEEWSRWWNPALHLAPWWPLRHHPNVLMLHYADLTADLEGEMRRIAAFLDIDVPRDHWEAVVERCRLDAMRDAGRASGLRERGFEGGADAFFNTGGAGAGAEHLSSDQMDRVLTQCAELLSHDASAWLESGGPLP